MMSSERVQTENSSRKGVEGFEVDRDMVPEVITPEQAKLLLENAATPEVDQHAVQVYAQMMEADSWLVNGMPIIISDDGKLLDGVQRLTAAVKTGIPLKTFVARNVRSDILHSIDQHKRRSYEGVLESRGIEEAKTLKVMMSKLIRIENGALGRENLSISWSRFDRVLESNPELYEAVKFKKKYQKSALKSTTLPVFAFMAIMAGKKAELDGFLTQLTFHHTEPANNAGRMFAMHLEIWKSQARTKRLGKNGITASVDDILAHAILYFNAYCEGQTLSKPLSWTPDYGTRNVVTISPTGQEVTTRVKATALDFDRAAAPANLGLPVVDGYKGIREGNYDRSRALDELAGETAKIVHTGAGRGGEDAYARLVTVTPDIATKWLSPQINRKNRKTHKNHVAAIVRDIKAGNWMMNAQPICFTKNPLMEYPEGEEPRLLNGQHRLLAIRDAGIPVELPIAVNIVEEAFATYDTHAKRSMTRAAGASSKAPTAQDERVLISALRFLYREENNISFTSSAFPTLTSSELFAVLDRHPGIEHHISRARRKGLVNQATAGVMTYFIYRALRENKELAEEFLDKLETGMNMTDPTDPASKARGELSRGGNKRRSKNRKEQIEILVSHWNAYIRWSEANKEKQIAAQKAAEKLANAQPAEVQDTLF